ncbi:hypothetical protein CBR_g69625 [Chara braunii]|uniref:CCHC-type domain-containing protein n=1 Tax=Chara braunii TaxID=69332 RepID=A0A388KLN9_CHABU|nr:hypothetical protein CBR_g8260 [Chara braunii]GBG93419.1 hypothetical protein CBR_g69625 [Chara braunii]|eukprot:GBG70960.1 hypothetical protein CBR_g8260 [Chara braunii]
MTVVSYRCFGKKEGSGSGSGGQPPSYPRNPMAGRTCYKCGDPDHFANVCKEYWEAKESNKPFVSPPLGTGRTKRTMAPGSERRNLSADSYTVRSESDETNRLMREYFTRKERARVEKIDKEKRGEAEREAEAARQEKARRKLEKEAEKKREQKERDDQLLYLIRMEIRRETGKKVESEESETRKYDRKTRKPVKTNERGETIEEEKERLRREIALLEAVEEEEEEDDELQCLRRRAAGLSIHEKRKRRKEMPIGDSPPMTTPTKRTGLSTTAKLRIKELRSAEKGKVTSSSILEAVGKIGLSLKHVMAGCGPEGKKKFEAECKELYEALTINEMKKACRLEKVTYGKRELVIKRLTTRRVLKAYDPVNIPLLVSPTSNTRVTRSAKRTEQREGKGTDDSSE